VLNGGRPQAHDQRHQSDAGLAEHALVRIELVELNAVGVAGAGEHERLSRLDEDQQTAREHTTRYPIEFGRQSHALPAATACRRALPKRQQLDAMPPQSGDPG
jgi:hypothetical protein